MEKLKEIDELTGIRFFAAIHVVLFHHSYLLGDYIHKVPKWILSIISFGDSAVSFFFILSGFILTYVYVDAGNNLRTSKLFFWWSRFSRIYPVYFFAFLIDFPRGIQYFFEKYGVSIGLEKIIISGAAYVGMVQSWYPRLTPVWNSPGWSLSTEMFFYLMFPFVVPPIFKVKKDLFFMLGLWLLPIFTYYFLAKSFTINLEVGMAATFWRSFPLLRLTEFAIGIFIGKIFIQKRKFISWMTENPNYTGLLFWISVFLSFMIVSINFEFPRGILGNTFLLPIFSFMILAIASVRVSFTGFLRMRLIVLFGGSSYALYVIHVPLLFYTNYLFKKISLGYGVTHFMIYLFTSVIFSIFLFYKLELPVQKILRKKYNDIKAFSK